MKLFAEKNIRNIRYETAAGFAAPIVTLLAFTLRFMHVDMWLLMGSLNSYEERKHWIIFKHQRP
jgi:hypothetical protein